MAVDHDSGDLAALSHTAETSAQIDPALGLSSDGTLAIAWEGLREGKPSLVGVRVSRDLGASWGAVQALVSPDGRAAVEPQVGVTTQGDVVVAWLGRRNEANADPREARVYVARSAAGSEELGPPVDVTEHLRRGTSVERPWVTVTPTGAPLVIWKYTAEGGNGIDLARGDADGAGKWVSGKVIERVGLQAWLPSVCASAHGDRVWVVYIDGEAGVRARASDDGATSWSPARATTVSTGEEKPRLAFETPVCAGDGDDMTVVYGRTREPRDDNRSPGLDSIVIARSFDGGRTYDWRRTIEIGGDAVALHPQVAREPDGTLDVAYYQTASGADAGDASSLRFVRLEKTGAPSAPRVATDHLRIARDRKSALWPGDSFGLAWSEGKIYFAGIDGAGDRSHVTFAGVASK